MRQRIRPAAPAWLEANGPKERDKARLYFEPLPGVPPSPTAPDFSAYGHDDVKARLREMFGGKCAYCEAIYVVNEPVDVEHYRPKGRIDTAAGKLTPGYWWLAASWDNLLPSCIDCNRIRTHMLPGGEKISYGKGDQFPVDDEAARVRKEGSVAGETPLLLNPCDDNPADYLVFVEEANQSIVKPVTDDAADLRHRRARASIDIYGLNRPELVIDRSRAMIRVNRALVTIESLTATLESVPSATRAQLEALIDAQFETLKSYLDGTDRYHVMALALIAPVFARLGLKLPVTC